MSQAPIAVLLVEDDHSYARLAAQMIASVAPDYRLVHETALAPALTRLNEHRYDAVLLDLGLPDSEGLPTLVKVSQAAPALPVVVLTSHADQSLAERALQRGAQDYVVKGEADSELLVRAVRYAIERKRATEAIRESENRYRLIFECNPQPMWVYDVSSHRFLAINASAESEYGYSRDEFLRMREEDLVADDGAAGHEQEPRPEVQETRTRTARHRRKDDTLIDVRVTRHALQFGDRPAHLVMVTNVSQELRAERRLRLLSEANAVLDSRHTDSILDSMARLTAGTIADLCIIIRLTEAGSVQRTHLAHTNPERQRELQTLVDRIAPLIARMPSEYRAQLQSGRSLLIPDAEGELTRYVRDADHLLDPARPLEHTSGVLVPLRSGDRVLGIMLLLSADGARPYDSDDLGLAEELARRTALAIENARLLREARELFDADLTGNFVATVDGRLLECNPAFARMLAYGDPAALIGRSASEIFGGDVKWAGFVSNVARDRHVRQQELALRDREGVQVHVLISATGLFSDSGEMVTIRGQLYDLTEHKQLEVQLSQSQKMEAVGRLAGGIAHDFNNLLMVIGGQAGRLLEQLPADERLRRNAQAIAEAADRAASLTQQLLAFSRRQVLSPQVIDLNTVVRNVHGMLERVIGEDITCVLALSSHIDNVKADPGRVEQALLNLAVNARDAMRGGGTLTISTSVVELDDAYTRQHISAKPGRFVMLAVSDTGSGMGPEVRNRVFEPFFTTKEIGKGTGLGLSMVYGIVKQSGGYIWVYSEVGIGTTFKIYLPSVDAPVEGPLPTPVPAVPTGSETILLVEDEDGVRELLEELLSAQGYQVMAASRGIEALQISEFFEDDIQLLVTDVVMPQMSGRELATRLRARRPGLRVLYLSGYTEEAIAHHGIIEPDAAFLQKPFTRADLARKIREVLAPRV